MSDITMCTGEDCELKETCRRYTAPVSPYKQSYFTQCPAVVKKDENRDDPCEYYWDDAPFKEKDEEVYVDEAMEEILGRDEEDIPDIEDDLDEEDQYGRQE